MNPSSSKRKTSDDTDRSNPQSAWKKARPNISIESQSISSDTRDSTTYTHYSSDTDSLLNALQEDHVDYLKTATTGHAVTEQLDITALAEERRTLATTGTKGTSIIERIETERLAARSENQASYLFLDDTPPEVVVLGNAPPFNDESTINIQSSLSSVSPPEDQALPPPLLDQKALDPYLTATTRSFRSDNQLKTAKSQTCSQSSTMADSLSQPLYQVTTSVPWTLAIEAKLRQLKANSTLTNTRRRTTLPSDISEKDKLKLWWFDAHQHQSKGIIYLFGKVCDPSTSQYSSCCVMVKNVMRTIFVLPRQYSLNEDGASSQMEKISLEEVKSEFSKVLKRHGIRSWSCRIRKRKYAFGLDNVPLEADYLKIQYSFNDPPLPSGINGRTFSHVFGTTNNVLEQFLIKRGIKGPQWLEISGLERKPVKETWCRNEFTVPDPKHVKPLLESEDITLETPPLSVMSLHLHTFMNSKTYANEIIAVAALFCPQVKIDEMADLDTVENTRFGIVRPWGNIEPMHPKNMAESLKVEGDKGLSIKVEHSEYALLNYLCARIHLLDPDVIIGHGFCRFTLDVLLHRMQRCNIPFWHKFGRFQWKRIPKLRPGFGGSGVSSTKEKALLTGRLICDTMTASASLIHSKSYHLSSLAETQLGIKREEDILIKVAELLGLDDTKAIIMLVEHCWMDSYLSMALFFKLQILPLTKKMTNIAGNLWSKSMDGSRMNRNEYLLHHEFHRLKYICPDNLSLTTAGVGLEDLEKEDDNFTESSTITHTGKANQKTVSYGGGLVLEPKTGFYDQFVVLLDFNSLYPSIIQEFNICFTTVKVKETIEEECTVEIPEADIPLGVLPKLMKRIVSERKLVKERMQQPYLDKNKKLQYDIEQNALKLTANSLYGCLGSEFSRFSARHLAAMITAQGRSILRRTVDIVEKQLNLDVIYGDTDSIMVSTKATTLEEADVIAKKVQHKVNGQYQLLELGIDGYFKRLLILSKKNYAPLVMIKDGSTWKETIKPKGSGIIRRDLSEISQTVTMLVLKIILSSKQDKLAAIHKALEKVRHHIRSGTIPLENFIIHKQLTKDIDHYKNAKGQAHLQVAMKMRLAGKTVHGGDTVAYVVCKVEEYDASLSEKATFPEDALQNGKEIDIDWYLKQEILPSVTKLCESMMDTSSFAEILGVQIGQKKDPTQLRQRQKRNKQDVTEAVVFKKLERKLGVQPFKLRCSHCMNKVDVPGYTRLTKDGKSVCGLQCPKCDALMSVPSIGTQLTLAIRHYIGIYYEGWLCCDNIDCDYQTRDCMLKCPNHKGCHGNLIPEYTSHMLYNQLLYFDEVFTKLDDSHQEGIADQDDDVFRTLRGIVRNYLGQCDYRYVDIIPYTMMPE